MHRKKNAEKYKKMHKMRSQLNFNLPAIPCTHNSFRFAGGAKKDFRNLPHFFIKMRQWPEPGNQALPRVRTPNLTVHLQHNDPTVGVGPLQVLSQHCFHIFTLPFPSEPGWEKTFKTGR